MPLKRIRMELARDPEFPTGSRDRGYDLIAPLDDAGHLSADEWRKQRERCRVRRFWHGEGEEIGHLVHRRGGTWAFDYDPTKTSDDEPGFKLDKHTFAPGEYVSIKEHDGHLRTFRIVAVVDFD